tara:strand:+ start:658 stop:1176 length:519 start_codon:yes stop_codon:yes gene_type:complete
MAAITPMMALQIAGTVFSAVQSMKQGAAQKSQYQIKAAQAKAKAERDSANALIEGNNVLNKLKETNAQAVATGFAGGVSGFSGSSALIQQINETYAGRDLRQLDLSARERLTFGQIQSEMFLEAGDMAEDSATFDALTSLTTGAISTMTLMPGSTTSGPVAKAGSYSPHLKT